jgi:hypothetical protein
MGTERITSYGKKVWLVLQMAYEKMISWSFDPKLEQGHALK